MEPATIGAFLAAADLAGSILSAPDVMSRWQAASALSGYTIGGLAGHLLLAVERLEVVLAAPEPVEADEVDLATFYGANFVADDSDRATGLHPLLRDAGEERGTAGPSAVAGELADLVGRLEPVLAEARPDRLVPVINVRGGATRLDVYLSTRVVELVVHADDLAFSAELDDIDVPPDAAAVVLAVAVELARARVGDLTVIRAFTRSERVDGRDVRDVRAL